MRTHWPLWATLLLLGGCAGGADRRRAAPPSADPSRTTDDGLAAARALARRGIPSVTPELDAVAASVSSTTPQLTLEPILSKANQDPPSPRIQPGDLIEITVYGRDEFSGERRVGRDGRVPIFLLGAVEAGGRTPVQAAELVRTSLTGTYMKRAQVVVWIKERAKRRARILGRVRKPGALDLDEERQMSLNGLVARAGGLLPDADGQRLTLVRADASGTKRCYHFTYQDLITAHLAGREVWLRPDDQLVVPRLPDIYVAGAVKEPGPITLRPGTTIAATLQLAGGTAERADGNGVLVLRGEAVIRVGLETPLRARDVVFVPERKRVYVVGAGVVNSGPIDLSASGLTVVQAIAEAGWFTRHADLDGVEILRWEGGKQVRIEVPTEAILEGKTDDLRLEPGDLVFVPETVL